MINHLYLKELKQSFRHALLPLILGIGLLMVLKKGSLQLVDFGLMATIYSALLCAEVFLSERNGQLDFLLSKPVRKTEVLAAKILAILTWVIPLYLIALIWSYRLGQKAFSDSMYYLFFSMFLLGTIAYDSMTVMMKDHIRLNLVDTLLRYLFIPLTMFYCVGLFIALNFKYIANNDPVIVYTVRSFPFIAVSYVLIVLVNAGNLLNRRKMPCPGVRPNPFRIILKEEISRSFRPFLYLMCFGLLLQVFLCLFDRSVSLKNVAGAMMMTSMIAGLIFPFMSIADHFRNGTLSFLLTRPVKKRTVLLAFGGASLFYVIGTVAAYLLFTAIFIRNDRPWENLLHMTLSFSLCSFFFSYWAGSLYFVMKHRKFSFPDRFSLVAGVSMIAGIVALLEIPEAAVFVAQNLGIGLIGFSWLTASVFGGCSLVLVRR